MIGSALINIIKVNDPRSGVKEGRPWSMQDCECLLLNEDGTPSTVGVLSLPKELMSTVEKLSSGSEKITHKIVPGIYSGAFSLRSGMRDRRIEAFLTALVPAGDRFKNPVASKGV